MGCSRCRKKAAQAAQVQIASSSPIATAKVAAVNPVGRPRIISSGVTRPKGK